MRPLNGSTSTISERPASDTRSTAMERPSGDQRGEEKWTPGSDTSGTGCARAGRAAGSDSVASSRRSSRWIVQTITRPSGETSGSPARAPWVNRSWPAAGIVDHVEV